MRPTVQETRDPLNAALIPESAARMELNYRTTTDPDAAPHPLLLCGISFLATLFGIILRPVLSLQTPLIRSSCFAVLWVALAWLAVRAWRGGRRVEAAVCILAIGVMPTSLSAPLAPFVCYVAFLCALTLAILFALEASYHAAAWHSAEMTVPIRARRRFMAVWHPAWLWLPMRRPGDDEHSAIRAFEYEERESLRRTIVFLAIAAFAGAVLVMTARTPIWAGLFATTAVAIVITGIVVVNLRTSAMLCRRSWRQVVRQLRDGWELWFGYNQQVSLAPGLLRSPAGDAPQRRARFYVAFVLFCASHAISAAYFPFSMLATDTHLWVYPPFAPSITGSESTTHYLPIPAHTQAYLNQLPLAYRKSYQETLASRFQVSETTYTTSQRVAMPFIPDPWLRNEGWLVYSWIRLFDGPGAWLPITLIFWAVLPPIFFFLTVVAVAGRPLIHLANSFEDDSPYCRPLSFWQAVVERLRRSRDPLEAEHLWIGVAQETNTPVMLHRKLVSEHVHLLGSTGSNKTAVGLAQMIEQVVGPESSVLILDLKGDMALFEAARQAAANAQDRRGRSAPIPFRWFTTESGFSTYVFNPFTQSCIRTLSRLERVEVYSKALGLEHGEGYGRAHFSLQNRNALLKLISACPDVDSFRQLHEEARRQRKLFANWEREHASDFFSVVHTLANIDALNVSPRDRVSKDVLTASIDMADVVREPQVVYFRLPATSQSASIRDVGKLAIHGLLTAAFRLGQLGRQIYIFIDEFQQLVSVDLSVVLQQARSMGLGVIMAHQTESDLELPERNMMQVVEDNTHFKQIFSVNDVGHREILQKLSGEALYHSVQWNQGWEALAGDIFEPGAGYGWSTHGNADAMLQDVEVNVKEEIGARLRPNDLAAMSARQDLCMVHFKRNIGYVQYDGLPFITRTDYHISAEDYECRRRTPWPAARAETITAPMAPESFFFDVSVEKPSASSQLKLPFPVSALPPNPEETETKTEPESETQTKPSALMSPPNPITSALDAE